MTYRVLYTANVRAEISAQVDYLRDKAVAEQTLDRWFTELFDTIDTLYEMPKRHPVDKPYSRQAGFEVRRLTFGDYLVRYRVDDGRRVVDVLSFTHGARRRD